MPDGYATRLGEHGVRLSGGQRQRLAIARTLLKGTDIVVLDEATAFMDPENEGSDQILVVDGGRIRERGRHDELVAARGLYARMWDAFEASEHIALGDAVHGAPIGQENKA
jgi:ATP-binding cassette subfamily B protein IrtA